MESNPVIVHIEKRIDVLEARVEAKFDKIADIMLENTMSLKEHMYRTELAEKRLVHIESDLKPIKGVMAGAKGVLAVIGGVATLAGLVTAIYEIISNLI